jgi:hypothetical protein
VAAALVCERLTVPAAPPLPKRHAGEPRHQVQLSHTIDIGVFASVNTVSGEIKAVNALAIMPP